MSTQRSMSRGEISPAFYAAADLAIYNTSLRSLRNAITCLERGVRGRAGTTWVVQTKSSGKRVKLIGFIFNADQTYILEFGEFYMRVHRLGAPVTEAGKAIEGVTQASQAVVTITAHGYLDGQELALGDLGGMEDLNGQIFVVANRTTDTFKLKYKLSGNYVDSSGFAAWTSGGTAARIYEIVTPYAEADLAELYADQQADVVTIARRGYRLRTLTRLAHNSWTLQVQVSGPAMTRPGFSASGAFYYNAVTTGGTTTGGDQYYTVTAISDENGEESLEGLGDERVISAITKANPARVTTATTHHYQTGDKVYLHDVTGMTEVNGRFFQITRISGTQFDLVAEDSTGYGTFTAGDVVNSVTWVDSVTPSDAAPVQVVVYTDPALKVRAIKVYRLTSGVPAFVGYAKKLAIPTPGSPPLNGAQPWVFDDKNDPGPDLQDTLPLDRDPFLDDVLDSPGVVGSYQQRKVYASSENDPDVMWASRPASPGNMSVHVPQLPDDAITAPIANSRVNEIRHLVDLRRLVIMTAGAELVASGDQAGNFTADSVNVRTSSYNGSSKVRPLVADNAIVYVQARNGYVRDMSYDAISDGLKGKNLSVYSRHLFDGHTIVDAAYQQIPDSVAWFVRDDGILLGMTYLPDEGEVGWHRHDTDGVIENVCVVPEENRDVLYWVVRRTIDGVDVRYIERQASSLFTDQTIRDAVCMDAAITYDGRNLDATHTMTLTGSGWTSTSTLTLTAWATFFKSTDVGNAIFLRGLDNSGNPTTVRCTITAYTSGTVVSVQPHKTVPTAMRAAPIGDWGRAVDEILGLWHLEGKDLSILKDGFVEADPNDVGYAKVTVASGKITLSAPGEVIQMGLPFIGDLETLDVDSIQVPGGGLMGEKKIVNKVWIYLLKTRGLWVGSAPPDDDLVDPLQDLSPLTTRDIELEDYDTPPTLVTGQEDQDFPADWNSHGRFFLRQTAPQPWAIEAILPEGDTDD